MPDAFADPGPRSVADRLAATRARVSSAALAAGRDPAEVRVLLATKTLPGEVVRAAVEAGGSLLGENRVGELVAHAAALAGLDAEVHLIGHLQSNKVAALLSPELAQVACVQSVHAAALAERLSRRCATLGRDLDVMVQVNVSGETSKQGVAPGAAAELATHVAGLPHLHLVGFMTVGLNSPDADAVRAGYARLQAIRDAVVRDLPDARQLSMGMSGDLELAVAEGATIVRVGSAVFGPRPAARPAGGG